MNVYLLPGLCGLMLGLLLHWTGFTRPRALQDALGLRRSHALRSGLYAIGAGMAMTALLCWLAVIDVDMIEVMPLSLGALTGGAVFGIAAALTGYTPLTAFGGLGGGNASEALCCMAGCLLGAWTLPELDGLLAPLRTAEPYAAASLFRMTLDEPWLLDGGFLGQGCAGLLLMAAAICVPSPRMERTEQASADTADAPSLTPEDAPQETFVALLPGEEPLVVDTAATSIEDNPAPDVDPDIEADAPREPAPDIPDTPADSPEDAPADSPDDPAPVDVPVVDPDAEADAPREPVSDSPDPESNRLLLSADNRGILNGRKDGDADEADQIAAAGQLSGESGRTGADKHPGTVTQGDAADAVSDPASGTAGKH